MTDKPYVFCFVKDESKSVPQIFIHEIEKHFQICWSDKFESNPIFYAKKVVAFLSVYCSVITKDLLERLPNLKILAVVGCGYDHIDVQMVRDMNVKVSNTPEVHTDTVAEMGMSLLLAAARNLFQNIAIAKSPSTSAFPKNFLCGGLSNKTLRIVGMGGIGCKLAKRAEAFKMTILYHNRNQRPDDHSFSAKYYASLNEMLPFCDYVMVLVSLTPSTRKMFGPNQFALMKKSASLINIARGGVVDHDALTSALVSGEIHFAALDVTDPEPLPRDHQLLKLKNVLITPHCASATKQTRVAMILKALDNILATIEGKTLPSEVLF